MRSDIIVPSVAVAIWCAIIYSGMSSGVSFVLAFIVANLAVCVVFLLGSIFKLARVRRR